MFNFSFLKLTSGQNNKTGKRRDCYVFPYEDYCAPFVVDFVYDADNNTLAATNPTTYHTSTIKNINNKDQQLFIAVNISDPYNPIEIVPLLE